jgi:serine protease Do
MPTKNILSTLCLSALLLPAAPPDPTSKARTPTHRVVLQRGGSYLGIGVAEITPERAKELHLKDERGIEVRCVDADSPAAKAGFKEGDVVLDYNGQRVEGGEQFMRLVRETPAGRSVPVLISRNGATQTLTSTIGQRRAGSIGMEVDGDQFVMAMPPMPSVEPLPPMRMPDIPRAFMSWGSPVLGIESESLNPQLAEYFGVKEGILVRSVTHESSAEKAGFKAGDVIIKVNGEKVTTPREISSILQSSRAKKSLPVTVIRRQKEVVLNVALEESSSWQALQMRELL